MKILSGVLRGRSFEQPKTRTVRPLSDKVRAAIFDVVGSVEDSTVLDVYAGSGAAGFEALSRGALMVDAIEGNPKVVRIIEANMKALGLDWGYNLHSLKIETWLALPQNSLNHNKSIARYDLIIADPPYIQLEDDIIERLSQYLLPDGILVVSHDSKRPSPVLKSVSLAKQKTYNDTALSFYKKD